MDVFDLVAKLSLDKSEYNEGLTSAKNDGINWGGAMATAGKTALAGITAVGTAVAGLGAGFASATTELAQYGDNIDKSSQKLGVSAGFYQEWEAVLEHSGTSMDAMGATFKKLATASQGASDDQVKAFERLGLSMKDVSKMSSEELFTNVITGLQGMEEGTERTALATTLLGKGAQEMGALLNTSAEDTQAMIDNVHNLGGVLSDDAIKATAQFQDNLQDLGTAFSGLKNNMLSEFLPSINTVMDGLIKVVGGDDSGLGQINEGINEFISNLTASVPQMLEVGASLVESLAQAILDNLPQLMEAGGDIVLELAQKLIESLPEIIKVGLEIIVSLAKSIGDSLPELIPTIVDVVLEITETLIDNVDLLIDGAVALIIGLAEGLINALPKLIEKAPEIVIKLVDAIIRNAPKLLEASVKLISEIATGLINNVPKLLQAVPQLISKLVSKFLELGSQMKDVGKNLIAGIKQGILDSWDSFKSWVTDKFKGIIDGVKDIFGIHSPSTVFKQIGEYCIEGLQEGSDELFSDDGLTAKVTADVESASGNNGISAVLSLLEQYLPQLSNQNIYLDGDTLVSSTAQRMDMALGRLSARRV